ncbi:hypothetical protein HMPREF9241_00762 [Schaalia turicensis ACS-279-V-Col4]|uniref:Uncharacterized protein n=1 Tax=Schaalia turicensis ACS-279-V-Col4 TaxID=883077 RepID=K0YQR8_9ACTO|nr:hypothetical protein [Schaalia turicensis]EJZ86137.1 hypothetical protein HMPREF9241_00762 [Schaalia turicensis ACS-279-V-Col4]
MEVDADRLKLARSVLRQAEEQTGLIHSASIGGAGSKNGVFEVNGNGHLIAVLASMLSGEAQVACVELKDMGWEALAKAGVDLSRFFLVPHAHGHCAQVCALFLDAFDVVCLGSGILASSERRQIATLVRAKRRTLFIYEHWVGISRPWNLAIEESRRAS